MNENEGVCIEYHPVYKQQQSTKQKIDGWIQVIDGKQTQNFARNEEELALIKNMSKLYYQRGCTVEYIAVYRQLKRSAQTSNVIKLVQNVNLKN